MYEDYLQYIKLFLYPFRTRAKKKTELKSGYLIVAFGSVKNLSISFSKTAKSQFYSVFDLT